LLPERQLGLGRERATNGRLVRHVRVQGQIDEVDLLLALNGIEPLETLGRKDAASREDLAEKALLGHVYFSTFSTLRLGALMFMFAGAAPFSPSVDELVGIPWGSSSGCPGSCPFTSFGFVSSSSAFCSSTPR